MTITIDQHFMLVQKAMKRFLEEENTSIYHELVADEREYFANAPIETFWSPDLPPLDHRMRQAIGKLILETAVSDLLPTENRAFSMA